MKKMKKAALATVFWLASLQLANAALSLDGHSTSTSTAGSQATSLTTTTGSGLVCALTYGGSGSGAITGMTATGLTFVKQISSTDGTGNTTEAWCAPFTTNFSGTITATWAAAVAVTNLTVFGIGGAATSSFADGSGGVSTSTSPSITTTNANDFIFSIQSDGFTPTAGGSFTLIDPGGGSFFNTSEYIIVSATQSSLVAAIGGTSSGGIVFAVKQAGGGGGGTVHTLSLTGAGK